MHTDKSKEDTVMNDNFNEFDRDNLPEAVPEEPVAENVSEQTEVSEAGEAAEVEQPHIDTEFEKEPEEHSYGGFSNK